MAAKTNVTRHIAARLPRGALATAGVLLLAAAGAGQTMPATRPAIPPEFTPLLPTAEQVKAEIARLGQVKELDEALRAKCIETYRQVLGQLDLLAGDAAKAEAFDNLAKDAPARLAATRQELEAAASQPAASAPAGLKLEGLQQLQVQANADLAAARKLLADLEAEPKRRSDRRLEIAKLSPAGQQRLAEVERRLAEPPKAQGAELTAAERALLQAQKSAIQQELDAYQKESASHEARRDLLTVRRDLAARRVPQAEKLAKALQDAIDEQRRVEADRAAADARMAAIRAAQSHPAVQKLAGENAKLATERTGPSSPAAKIVVATKEMEEVRAASARLQQAFAALLERAKAIGRTPTFGVLLRKQRAQLPPVRRHLQSAKAREAEVVAVQLRLMELEDWRAELANIDARVEQVLAGLPASVDAAGRARIAETAKDLMEEIRSNLDALMRDYDAYFTKLIDLDGGARALVAKAQEAAAYIDERVLWIRSAQLPSLHDAARAAQAGRWLFGPAMWARVGGALWAGVGANLFLLGAGVGAFGALLAIRRRAARRLRTVGAAVAGAPPDRFLPTVEALALTLLLAAMVPAFAYFIAWRLAATPATDPVRAVAAGLRTAALVLLTLGVLIQALRTNGLGKAHFRWAIKSRAGLKRSLTVLAVILAALGFVVSSVEWQDNEAWKNSLGRAALIAALLVAAVFALRLLRPSGPVLADVLAKAPLGWLSRMRQVWYPAAVAAPAALAVLALLGFQYTALHLSGRLAVTFWLVTVLVVVHGLGTRWIRVGIRKLARRRAAQRAGAEADGPAEPHEQAAARDEVRLDAIHAQMRRLLRWVLMVAMILGAWRIWSTSLPALAAMRRVELWTHTVSATRQIVGSGGKAVSETASAVEGVTLADAALAVLMVVLTVVAVRNIPALLEVPFLQRLHMDAGARYATKAVLRYAIAVTGVILAFRLIGVSWSSVQWLVAAMSVGLGFGLQEIFANFVSGLIILFERPIRIGDTVTIGETSGTVTRIRIRATTVTDWDRKELVVPNKEFVTGRLVNWSLSDRVLRVILRVGIAYGSDTELAEKILYEQARAHPLVLDDPRTVVVFAAFGDNSLNFELRVYIGGIEHYLPVWHGLNMAIDKAFRDAGITVAFPQQDTHLDTLKPLEIRVLPAEEARGSRSEGPRAPREGS